MVKKSLLLLFLMPICAFAQTLPWLKSVDTNHQSSNTHTITSSANVTVSDGLTYKTETLFHDHQRAVFKRVYQDRTVTQAVEGKYVWSYDGKAESEMPPFLEGIILGHQFHAQILYFDKLWDTDFTTTQGEFNGIKARSIVGKATGRKAHFYFDPGNKPLGFTFTPDEQPTISFVFKKWQSVDGFNLPYQINIDDGKRQFTYKFDAITFNEGRIEDYRAPDKLITEEQRLLRMHRAVMDDHFFERTDALAKMAAEQTTIVSGGEVYELTKADNLKGLNRIMNSRYHWAYDDLIRPKVTISQDGSLGWVIVQVKAEGVRIDKKGNETGPLAFTSAWIELYQKQNKQWKMVGNVSNFKG